MKKTEGREISFPLGAGLLILGSLALPFALADEELSVDYVDGLVTLNAEDVATTDLLEAITAEANLRLVQHAELDGTLTASFDAEPLTNVLDTILQGGSYQLLQSRWTASSAGADWLQSGTLWIFSVGNSPAPRSTVSLEAALLEGDYKEKKAAIRALRKAGDAPAVQSLSLALSDPDTRIRDAALEALSRIGSDDSLAAIASLVTDGDAWTRIEAANALSLTASRSALRYLEMALNDPDPRVRMAAIDAFADIPSPDAVAAIQRAINDPDPDVRAHAVEMIEDAQTTIAFHARRQALGRRPPGAPGFGAD